MVKSETEKEMRNLYVSEAEGYYEIRLGNGQEEIQIKLLDEPFVKNSVGIVESPSFCGRKAVLFVDQRQEDERDFEYAALGYAKETGDGHIYMEERVYQGLLRQESVAIMILLHEIGHFFYHHSSTRNKEDPMQEYRVRLEPVRDGTVSRQETDADEFAGKYLGYSEAANALEQMNMERMEKYGTEEYDPVEVALAIKEVEFRACHLREKENDS